MTESVRMAGMKTIGMICATIWMNWRVMKTERAPVHLIQLWREKESVKNLHMDTAVPRGLWTLWKSTRMRIIF